MVGLQLCLIPCLFCLYQDIGHFCPACNQRVAHFPYRGKAAKVILPGQGTRVYRRVHPATHRKGKQPV
ncbi:hypothetical protein PG994_005566 [Apiospora phragmitis]|uniref:LITAF domain-containing protein n=1 Tax=Apiospora phragmitis TaxID=2905665 RepID=A0ABR1VCL5_9PEZI